ncbi:MAG: hypothetical protein HFE61_00755 [Anaerotignum sp.]|jgi:hypothetical protein|nr:hypothetical protein [Anaerotignum sp.]
MAKKSSKTAHVLNLISPSKAEEPALETPAVQNTASDASPAAQDTTVVQQTPTVQQASAVPDAPAVQQAPPVQDAPAPTPVSTAEKPQEPPKSKPKAETMEGILHLSENTENLSLLIRDNLEKEFSLQNPPPQPFWGGEGVPIAENPHAVIKEVAPANTPLPEPLTAEPEPEPAFAAESPLPETPFLPAEPDISETLPAAQEPLDEPVIPAAQEPLDEPVIPVAQEPLDEPILPVAQEPLDEPILPVAQEPLDEPVIPVAQEPLDEPILPVAQEPLDEPILPVAQEPLDEPVIPVAHDKPEKTVEEMPAESEPVPEEPEDDGEPAENKQFCYTNVYERIIKGCVLEYLERFGVCTCSRCVADTTALALTNLPSKYIVTDFSNVEPLLSLYEHKFEVAIMTELTKACFEVDAHPHHKI